MQMAMMSSTTASEMRNILVALDIFLPKALTTA